MHIVLFHNAIIPPIRYGGTERVIYWLAKALIQLGHSVTLIARPGSVIPRVNFIPIDPKNIHDWESWVPSSCDILHLWSTPPIHAAPKKPFLITIEGNGKIGETFHPNTVFVSRKHADLHGTSNFVYNGIDPEDYFCDPVREPYLVFLAKASWKVKNLVGAIEIAKKTGLPLKVMGNRNWPLRLNRFFSPRWGQVQYLGMLTDPEKRKVLRKAQALLFPVRWHEPFGIAITEALASGCPVYGTPYGSLPEIIHPSVGHLSTDPTALAHHILNQKISPSQCRDRVYQGFTHIQMAQSYLKYYEKILNQGCLTPNQPEIQWRDPLAPEALLPW